MPPSGRGGFAGSAVCAACLERWETRWRRERGRPPRECGLRGVRGGFGSRRHLGRAPAGTAVPEPRRGGGEVSRGFGGGAEWLARGGGRDGGADRRRSARRTAARGGAGAPLRLRGRRRADHRDAGLPEPARGARGGGPVIRLGRIGYVNMAPVFYRVEADYDEVVGVPTALNRALLDGECDLAPISSIEYARHADRLRLLPRLCVSSEGAVDSIQLVSRAPLEQVRMIAVTPESATSVVLTKVLLPEAEHVPLGEDADARLLIGDAALKSAFEDPTPHYDLGRLWLERTGLPMVFAVWAAPEPTPPELLELEDALVASVRLARAEPERLAYEASERYGYPAGFLARYFEKLRYSFGPRERAGLLTFLELARDVGELDEVPELRFVARAEAVHLTP